VADPNPRTSIADCIAERAALILDVHGWLKAWAQHAPVKLHTTPDGVAYANAESLVLALGRRWPQGDFTQEERDYIRECVQRAGFTPQLGCCFENTRRILALGDVDRRLTYCEGFASAGIPYHHAWLLLDGRPVDVTWKPGEFGLPGREAANWHLHGRVVDISSDPMAFGAAVQTIDYFGIEHASCPQDPP
jgi:hypothetical protein